MDPSSRSISFRVLSSCSSDAPPVTGAWKRRALLHIVQCWGIFAGASASRTPTGVRSPGEYEDEPVQAGDYAHHV